MATSSEVSLGQSPSTPKWDAVRLLQLEIWFLFLIPTGLRIGPLGAIGHPAVILGVLLFFFWGIMILSPSIDTDKPCRPVRLVLTLFWMSLLISYAVMNRRAVVADELSNSDRFLISFLAFTGLALVAAEGIPDMASLMKVIRTAVAATATMSLIAILQSRTSFDATTYIARIPGLTTYRDLSSVLGRSGFNRPAGTATHPIEFGVVVGVGLAFVLQVVLFDRTWSAPRRILALALIGLGIPIAVSRSALLVAVIVLIAFLVGTTTARRRQVLPVLLTFLIVVFIGVPGLLGTLKGYIFAGENDSSISTRTDDYAAVSHYLRSSPWLGRGPGSFLPRLRILDNQYLLTLIETGIVGALVFLAVFSLPAWLGRSGRKRFGDEGDRNLGQMFAGAGIGVVAAAATYDSFSFPMFTSFAALLIGLSGCYWRLSRLEPSRSVWPIGDLDGHESSKALLKSDRKRSAAARE